MPKNPQSQRNMSSQPYDPVPPYDLDDIENGESRHSTQQVDGDVEEGVSVLQQEERGGGESNIIESDDTRGRGGGRAGRLTERECCDYAFLYFKTVVLGVVLVVFFVCLFSYLGRKR